MELTPELKRRFCKNCNIPISIFVEPFFTDRIKLFSMYYNTIEELQKFVKSIEPYDCEQDYYEHYNKTKDAAINFIKGTEWKNLSWTIWEKVSDISNDMMTRSLS